MMVFVNVLLDQLGLPIPSFPTLLVAGAIAASAQLDLIELFSAALIGSVIADALWYAAGWRFGTRVMRTLCRLSLTPDSCVGQTQTRFERWGVNALLFAKFVPGLATIARPMAGAARIRWPRFLYFDSPGAALWVGAALGTGAVFNTQIGEALAQLSSLGWVALGVIGVPLLLFIAFKWQQRRSFMRTLRMARISVDELYRLMNSATDPLIVNVRSATARAIEPRQIPRSVHVPLDAIDRHASALPRNREIVLYCTCPTRHPRRASPRC